MYQCASAVTTSSSASSGRASFHQHSNPRMKACSANTATPSASHTRTEPVAACTALQNGPFMTSRK